MDTWRRLLSFDTGPHHRVPKENAMLLCADREVNSLVSTGSAKGSHVPSWSYAERSAMVIASAANASDHPGQPRITRMENHYSITVRTTVNPMSNRSIGRLLSQMAHALVAKMTTSSLSKVISNDIRTCSRSEHMTVMALSNFKMRVSLFVTYPG